ncbi:hypothetical protein AB0O47_20000 [Streptomyces noursei]|uniref:hypothetical protein n=1 Tax=Streptomyces noursei TaxID=1971 RepID=UPI00344D2A97
MSMQPVRVRLDDSPVFEAVADLGNTWDRFLRPRFTLDQLREVAEYTQAMHREHGVDWETVHIVEQSSANRFAEDGRPAAEKSALVLWVSWEFTLGSEGPSKYVTVVDPDEDGLYDVGGGAWAWTHVPEPERIRVGELKSMAGARVRFVGEYDDPCEIAKGKLTLPDWQEAYVVYGGGLPAENAYFCFFDEVMERFDRPQEAAQLLVDLPVCLVQTRADLEYGICPTSLDRGWQWSVAEAFTRLGILPPVDEMSLPDKSDVRRSPELVRYLVEAFEAGIWDSISQKQSYASQVISRLADAEATVNARA